MIDCVSYKRGDPITLLLAIRRSCVIPSLTNSPVEADPDAEEDEGEEEEDGEDADERDLHVRQERPAKKRGEFRWTVAYSPPLLFPCIQIDWP